MGSRKVRNLSRAPAIGPIVLAALCLTASAQSPTSTILQRARSYAAEYERQFSFLVAEEKYVQEVRRPRGWRRMGAPLPNGGGKPTATSRYAVAGDGVRQELRSVYLIVGGDEGWIPFRDVFERNGVQVHDRVDRLTRLFREGTASRFALARQIMAESTRFNVGDVQRTINIPVLAMLFLLPRHEQQFTFVSDRTERVNGRAAAVFRFEETRRPTLVKTGIPPTDMPSTGRVWIETDTGRVLRTEHRVEADQVGATVTVDFREEPRLAFLVPDRMQEVYRVSGILGTVRGLATYSKYQRVHVSTDEKIAAPKKPPPDRR